MQRAETLQALIRERGTQGKPLERVYRMLFNPDLYLIAYAKLYGNNGALTPGTTGETVDGMSTDKIRAIIEHLRHERYRWRPARRVYIPSATRGRLDDCSPSPGRDDGTSCPIRSTLGGGAAR
jgi:hypothetical protein